MLPAHNAYIRAEIEAIIDEILVVEGQPVEKGAVVARLSDLDYRAALGMTDAQIREKRANLRLLEAGPRKEEVALARREVDKEITRLAHAKRMLAEAHHIHAERIAKAQTSVNCDRRLKAVWSAATATNTVYTSMETNVNRSLT